jgi:hypothetical protein
VQQYSVISSINTCVYCNRIPVTRDHCPSKVFLDSPYPENLPTVPACEDCNAGFSIDEEYLACFISCAISGTTEPHFQIRTKTRKILESKPALAASFQNARTTLYDKTSFHIEVARANSILVKLAKGHLFFELNLICDAEPTCIKSSLLREMSASDQAFFLRPNPTLFYPEVGSRSLVRFVERSSDSDVFGWVHVQAEQYRYHVSQDKGVVVRILFSENFAAIVSWNT